MLALWLQRSDCDGGHGEHNSAAFKKYLGSAESYEDRVRARTWLRSLPGTEILFQPGCERPLRDGEQEEPDVVPS